MKNFFTLTLCFLTLSLTAQEPLTYPFNPDANGDTFVGVSDVLEGISTYDNFFFPEEIMVGDTTLSNWIQILNQTLSNQQAVIDSLQASLASQDTQLDSTMIADMIAAAGGLGSGGGCDVRFPDGLDGEYFTTLLRDNEMNDYPYTVPEGKTLYITSAYAGDEILITNNNGGESKIITGSNGGGNSERSLHNPIILYEGQTVSGYGNPNNPTSINAFLIDSGVEPITVNGGSFQVPLGKKLYVTNIRGDFYLDNDNELIKLASNSGYTHFIGHPIVFNSNQTAYVSGANTNDGGTFNGYLVDEDYFANCGGGGSSEGIQGLAFGERVNLGEPEDWGDSLSLPWVPYVSYGVYDFESDGLVTGQSQNYYYNFFILNDSIEVGELTYEAIDEYIMLDCLPEIPFTIPIREDEKLVITGPPTAFEEDELKRIQWIPLESEPVGSSEGDNENDDQISISYVDFSQEETIVELQLEDLTDMIICRLNGNVSPGTNFSLELPTENILTGHSIKILNDGLNGQSSSGLQLSPIMGNDGQVKNGYIGNWTFYNGNWYTIYEPD